MRMEKIEISKMTLADYETIKTCLCSEFDDFWTPAVLKSELMGENKIYFVAKKETQIIGFVGIMMANPEMELLNLVVKKSERGNGVGTILLNKIIEIAETNKIETIFLEVNEINHLARKLYEKAGFFEIGIRKNYYHSTENAILMSKNVNNLQK